MNAKHLLSGLAAALGFSLLAFGGTATAASYDLTTSYGDGGSFVGEVTFNADESEVEGVTGYLYDYSPVHGYTGHALDVSRIDTYAGSCSPIYTSACFDGGVWTNSTGVSGFAFNYTGTAGLPEYVSGYDGDSSGHYSTVSTGYFSPLPNVSAAPEPSTWALLVLGIGGIGLMLRRAGTSPGFRWRGCLAAPSGIHNSATI